MSFETFVSTDDFAFSSSYSGNAICKYRIDRYYVMAYATPVQVSTKSFSFLKIVENYMLGENFIYSTLFIVSSTRTQDQPSRLIVQPSWMHWMVGILLSIPVFLA